MMPDTRVGMTFGHEFVGVVHEIGPSVEHLKPGDRVMVPFNIFCGTCFFPGDRDIRLQRGRHRSWSIKRTATAASRPGLQGRARSAQPISNTGSSRPYRHTKHCRALSAKAPSREECATSVVARR
jgi:hypothetical protein